MSDRTIPVVDLSQFVNGSEEDRKAFVEKLGTAFHEVGFVGVVNHGVPVELVDTFYGSAKEFFGLSVDTKEKYEVKELAGQRGYTSFGREKAKQSEVADLKEFYQFGQIVEDNDPIKSQYPDNIYVEETPVFTNSGVDLY
ncbi:MAG: 2-oxoglutarate and iron-dependent oxygenase domain-containing protein, partial [Saprospiraceae bacterium]